MKTMLGIRINGQWREDAVADNRLLLRQRRCDQYVLKTMAALEAAGLGEFIENLGLNFPIH